MLIISVQFCGISPCIIFLIQYSYFILDHAHSLLNHAHEWVRLSSVQLLGIIISVIPASEIVEAANNPEKEKSGYLLNNPRFKLKSLALDLTSQLIPGEQINEKFLKQVNYIVINVFINNYCIYSLNMYRSIPWLF